MARSWIWTDGNGSAHNIFIDGTTTERDPVRDTEEGEGANYEHVTEELPSRWADRYRATLWPPRTYSHQFVSRASTRSGMNTNRGEWEDWMDPELGEGELKRVLANGSSRVLDAYPLPLEIEDRVGYNLLVTPRWQAPNPFWRSDSENLSSGTIPVALTITNSGFETFAGTADDDTTDDFTGWTEYGTSASNLIEATGTEFAGTYAAKLTYVDGRPYMQSGNLGVTASDTYRLRFWARGDGTAQGAYRIYDVDNATAIQTTTDTGVTGTDWDEVTKEFDAPSGCGTMYLQFYASNGSGVAFFDDVRVTKLRALSCANNGDIPAFCRFVIEGQTDNPRIETSDGDYIRIKKATSNAADEIHVICRPTGTNPYTAKFYENGTGSGTFVAVDSGSKMRIKIPKGTSNVTIEHEDASNNPTASIYWYDYYESLY